MKRCIRWEVTGMIMSLSLLVSVPAAAVTACFDDTQVTPEQQERFYTLLEELRCMKCDNQTLLDSPAGVADDMRNTICQQVRSGDMSNDEIKDYFVSLYDERIVFMPRGWFWVLWPFLGIVIIAGVLFLLRKRGGTTTDCEPSSATELRTTEAEHAEANTAIQNLLKSDEEGTS